MHLTISPIKVYWLVDVRLVTVWSLCCHHNRPELPFAYTAACRRPLPATAISRLPPLSVWLIAAVTAHYSIRYWISGWINCQSDIPIILFLLFPGSITAESCNFNSVDFHIMYILWIILIDQSRFEETAYIYTEASTLF